MRRYQVIAMTAIVSVAILNGCAANSSENSDNKEDYSVETESISLEDSEDVGKNVSLSEEFQPENERKSDMDELSTDPTEDDFMPDLTSTQRNSLNMLNYITVLTQQINESRESRVYLESVQSSLLNNIYPNAVDTQTQKQINNLWENIDGYRMVAVKRERLDYIYEQNKAQALRQAIPNPLGLLSVVQSGNILKSAASVLYMAVDSISSYQSASTQADLDYLQDNWELDDEEAKGLSTSQLNLLNYMIDMVRDNDFPGEWSLNVDSVEDFVRWCNEDNVVSRIAWLEENEETYREFRGYWLELSKSYYEDQQYENCIAAIEKYENIATRIFRKDYDYATALPMVIISAKETMDIQEYEKLASQYSEIILDNADSEDWDLRYFVSQIYIDLYANTKNMQYLNNAYNIAFADINILVKEQEKLNSAYLDDVQKEKVDEDTGDKKINQRRKKEVKEYNKLLAEKRKVELPPVNEFFYLNCDLLFDLADKLEISQKERDRIDSILHEDEKQIFLTEILDNIFWASKESAEINIDGIEVKFDGNKLVIPANLLTDRYSIEASLSDGTKLDDWAVEKVKRPKGSSDCSEFMVTLSSKKGKDQKYTVGEIVTVLITPVADKPEKSFEIFYEVIEKKTLGVIKHNSFERIAE